MNNKIRIVLFVLVGLVLSLMEQMTGFLSRLLPVQLYLGAWWLAVLLFVAWPAVLGILKEDHDDTD